MRILVLGGDGYLGWPQALYLSSQDLSSQGHDGYVVGSLVRRRFGLSTVSTELGVILPPQQGPRLEQFTLTEIAGKVVEVAHAQGLAVKIDYLPTPRAEAENHYYRAVHTRLEELDYNRACSTRNRSLRCWSWRPATPTVSTRP